MSTLQRVRADVEIRALSEEDRTVEIVASSFAKDSYRTRIRPDGWDVDQFAKRNAQILWAHDDRGRIVLSAGLPIGKGLGSTVRVQDGNLLMRVQFTAQDENPFGYMVYKLVKGGYINMVSVGFDPLAWEDVEEDGEMVRHFTKQRLMEVSFVAIGANDDALVVRARENNEDPEEVRGMLGELETLERAIRTMTPHLTNAAEFEKYKAYFEKKQPANRASTKVLERFFKARGEEQPADEVAAWKRMDELIDQPSVDTVTPPTATVTVPVEPAPVEQKAEETPPAPEQKIEEEPPPPPTPVEAPQVPEEAPPDRSIPLSALKGLPEAVLRAAQAAVEKASRRGVPSSDWKAIGRKAGIEVLSSISAPSNE